MEDEFDLYGSLLSKKKLKNVCVEVYEVEGRYIRFNLLNNYFLSVTFSEVKEVEVYWKTRPISFQAG